jgi:hypothetical protein
MRPKRARSLIVSALLDLLDKQNRFFWVLYFQFPALEYDKGGRVMDDLTFFTGSGFVLGVLVATFGYLLTYLFDHDNA